MESAIRNMCQLGLLLALVIAGLGQVNGAGECGIVSADIEALTLAPCASAAQDVNVAVSSSCCDAVQTLSKNPACLCAVLLCLILPRVQECEPGCCNNHPKTVQHS
ncbi:hypothetical protein R6Q57_005151 [Mikania cordata]